jgi:poly(beta-D-mannuronate) lyase
MQPRFTILVLLIVYFGFPSMPQSSEFDCGILTDPIINVTYDSRYSDDSITRANYDEQSNAHVNRVLKPIDDFGRNLIALSNLAIRQQQYRDKHTNCVVDKVYQWAKADALKGQNTIVVKMTIPPRYGIIAMALAQLDIQNDARFTEQNAVIKDWLQRRSYETIIFFQTKASGSVPRANLRGWAALATTQVGLLYDNQTLIRWGILSNQYILSFISDDGSHPDEMRRGQLALHYQLHATAPLSTSTALLIKAGFREELAYLPKLEQMVDFTIAALKDPRLVEAKFNSKQSIAPGLESIKPSMIAWVEPYLSIICNAQLNTDINPLRPLNNSKLGGNLTHLYHGDLNSTQGCNHSAAFP